MGTNSIDDLLVGNKLWCEAVKKSDPEFFAKLSSSQNPDILWIGCSDSRVPANQITGRLPGDIFVHRNVANLVYPTDANLLSVLHFAVKVLKVKNIVVCGHYNCAGVATALQGMTDNIANYWLSQVRSIHEENLALLKQIGDKKEMLKELTRLCIKQQVKTLSTLPLIREAWDSGAQLALNGLVYNVATGELENLDTLISSPISPE